MVLDEVPECTEMDPSYFFADPNDDEEPHGNSERVIAISACNRCPLKTACFQYAIVNDVESGVWGGSVPAQRSAYREKMRNPTVGWVNHKK